MDIVTLKRRDEDLDTLFKLSTKVAGNVDKRLKFTIRLPESSIFIRMIVLLRMVEKSVGKRAKPPNNAEWRYSLSLYRHTT